MSGSVRQVIELIFRNDTGVITQLIGALKEVTENTFWVCRMGFPFNECRKQTVTLGNDFDYEIIPI